MLSSHLTDSRGDFGDGAAVLHQQGLDVRLELLVLGRAQQVVQEMLRRLGWHLTHAAVKLGLPSDDAWLLGAGVIWEETIVRQRASKFRYRNNSVMKSPNIHLQTSARSICCAKTLVITIVLLLLYYYYYGKCYLHVSNRPFVIWDDESLWDRDMNTRHTTHVGGGGGQRSLWLSKNRTNVTLGRVWLPFSVASPSVLGGASRRP